MSVSCFQNVMHVIARKIYLRHLLIINIVLDVFTAMQSFPILCIVFCCTFSAQRPIPVWAVVVVIVW